MEYINTAIEAVKAIVAGGRVGDEKRSEKLLVHQLATIGYYAEQQPRISLSKRCDIIIHYPIDVAPAACPPAPRGAIVLELKLGKTMSATEWESGKQQAIDYAQVLQSQHTSVAGVCVIFFKYPDADKKRRRAFLFESTYEWIDPALWKGKNMPTSALKPRGW